MSQRQNGLDEDEEDLLMSMFMGPSGAGSTVAKSKATPPKSPPGLTYSAKREPSPQRLSPGFVKPAEVSRYDLLLADRPFSI